MEWGTLHCQEYSKTSLNLSSKGIVGSLALIRMQPKLKLNLNLSLTMVKVYHYIRDRKVTIDICKLNKGVKLRTMIS